MRATAPPSTMSLSLGSRQSRIQSSSWSTRRKAGQAQTRRIRSCRRSWFSTTLPMAISKRWRMLSRRGRGRLSSQMANFLDQAGGLWARGVLHGKVGGAFTSSATQHGGQETTLFSIITNLLHFGMVVVGLDYGHTGQMTLDEITGGSPYSP